ncbi:PKD domain-containing protein [Nocardioides sp. WS12]|uniref:PKD domain-containing protein n=1 Tax=Nocardioides sp. WS12 TaxID=2486272 RepID=UPI0015FC45F4|nr:PKD domain-containing protein [Nocardioides sp. WS12]
MAGTKGPKVFLYPMCAVKVGAVCGRNLTCTTEAGKPGVFYQVTVNGEPSGRRCIGAAEANAAGAITPGQVLEAMRRLKWPASPLVVQPPNGLTLVNFDTIFYTTGTAPVTRSVTLLGQRITIEATPSEYHWTFGDQESLKTTDPGAPYPALAITHNYLRTGTYAVSLDTTYSGRFRVGNGAWQDIAGTVTVQGTPETLRAIEATPKLVGY